jgi:hypothetical protein
VKRSTDAEHCRKAVAPSAYHKLALVGGTGNLVQVAANASEFRQGALEGQQLLLREWRQRPQVSSVEACAPGPRDPALQ